MTDKTAFTTRMDPGLVAPLDERVRAMNRSRNWGIEQAVKAWLDGGAADDTRTGMSPDTGEEPATARAASAGGPRGAQPPPRHFHRFAEKVADSPERRLGGQLFATFRCECGKEVERPVR
jgi:hypothetical protein